MADKNIIDLDKLDTAYKFLKETEQGAALLTDLRASFDTFQAGFPMNLNRAEFLYVLRSLTNGMLIDEDKALEQARKGPVFGGEGGGAVPQLGGNDAPVSLSRIVAGNFVVGESK